MRIERNGRKEQYTFEDVRELTLRAAGFFAKKRYQTQRPRDFVLEQYAGMGHDYFGILKAGATAIPIDPASTIKEIIAFAQAGEASAIVVSPKLAGENPDMENRLKEAFC